MTDADLVGQSLADLDRLCVYINAGPGGAVELLYSIEVALRNLSRDEFDAALFETRQRRIGNKPKRPAAKAAQPAETPRPAASKRVGYGGHARER